MNHNIYSGSLNPRITNNHNARVSFFSFLPNLRITLFFYFQFYFYYKEKNCIFCLRNTLEKKTSSSLIFFEFLPESCNCVFIGSTRTNNIVGGFRLTVIVDYNLLLISTNIAVPLYLFPSSNDYTKLTKEENN